MADLPGERSDEREVEAVLIVDSDDPATVIRQLESIKRVARYRLRPADAQSIKDCYFDTPDRQLQRRKLVVRLRAINAGRLVALKGPSTGGWERGRLEIELVWSNEACARILNELADRGVNVERPAASVADGVAWFAAAGLQVVQTRAAQRAVRAVVADGPADGTVLAELAIDTVLYQFGTDTVRIHEVEVEAKGGTDAAVPKAVAEALVAIFNGALRAWDYSKFRTGKAIEALLARGSQPGWIDAYGNVTPNGYRQIEAYLESGSTT